MTPSDHLQICLDLWNQGQNLHWYSEAYLNLFVTGRISLQEFLMNFTLPNSGYFDVLECIYLPFGEA